MTIAAAFALAALTGPMVMAIVALALLWGRPLANDQELYDCSRRTLEDPSGGLSMRVMPRRQILNRRLIFESTYEIFPPSGANNRSVSAGRAETEVNMAGSAKSALVLQGGGALGAYELGAARALYKVPNFSPDLIAGVSIGAVTAVLLARPKKGMTPLEALEAFWQKVSVPAPFFPKLLRPYASFLGNPNFFTPRQDYWNFFNWTYFYDTAPLRRTLEDLIDLEALGRKTERPRLLVSATDLKDGQIEYFYSVSDEYSLTLDHIMASGSLPPAFPMTLIGRKVYWDGGLFDNTPLGAVLDHLNDAPDVDRTVMWSICSQITPRFRTTCRRSPPE